MTLSQLQGHSLLQVIQMLFLYSWPAADKISVDSASRGPSASAELLVTIRWFSAEKVRFEGKMWRFRVKCQFSFHNPQKAHPCVILQRGINCQNWLSCFKKNLLVAHVMGQYCFACWRRSSSSVTLLAGGRPAAGRAGGRHSTARQ